MERVEKVKLFKNILLNQAFIEVFNLTSDDEIELYENGLGYNYNIKCYNSERWLDIKLCIAYDYNDMGDSISIIINKNDQVDIDEDQYFLLSDWLDSSKRDNDWKLFYLNVYEGSFEEKLKAFFAYLNGLFEDEELSKVLRGETWMNFGFDWRGMK